MPRPRNRRYTPESLENRVYLDASTLTPLVDVAPNPDPTDPITPDDWNGCPPTDPYPFPLPGPVGPA